MSAAVLVSAPERTVDLAEIRRELSQLHILLLGVRADLEDALGPAPARGSTSELRQGIKRAFACLDHLRSRIEEA